MKALVVYDSVYGNTQRIAEAIGAALGSHSAVIRVGQVELTVTNRVDLLVVGSPTLGGRPSQPVQDWLNGLPQEAVKGTKIAAFDTRYAGKFVKIFGYAAEKIADSLVAKGAALAAPPQGFIVTGKKGPLKEGELDRASAWASSISG